MKMTPKQPMQPGYYWATNQFHNIPRPVEVFEVCGLNGSVYRVRLLGTNGNWDLDYFPLWSSEPIEAPNADTEATVAGEEGR